MQFGQLEASSSGNALQHQFQQAAFPLLCPTPSRNVLVADRMAFEMLFPVDEN